MPTIPRYDAPTTAPASPSSPTPQQGGFASPDAFGAGVGQAESGLGQTLEKVGGEFERSAQAFQAQENEAAANTATTEYLIKQSALTENFKLLQGKDPKEAMAQYTKDLQDLKTSMRQGLSNPEVARQFDQATTRQFGYAVMNGAAYASTQFKSYTNQQADAKVKAYQSSAAQSETDEVFQGQLKDMATEIRERSGIKGQSEEVIQGKIRDEQGKAWSTRLNTLALTDPTTARALLNKNRASIDGIVAQNAEDNINKQDIRVSSARIANTVALGGATDTKEQKEAYAMSVLTPKYGKAGAAAIVGGLVHESGLKTDARNPGDGADGSDSIGSAQWNGQRAIDLKKFAEQQGTDWRDFKTQVAFVDKELSTTHRKAGDALKTAATVEQAAGVATLDYEVPAGAQTRDLAQVPSHGARVAQAQRIAQAVVQPIATLNPGNRGALEATARQQANAYADAQGLDPTYRAQLIETTVNRLDTAYSKQQATARDAAVGGKATLTQFVTNGPDGKNPVTDIDAVMGPNAPEEVRNSFLQLPPAEQKSVRDLIGRNAAANLTPTVATDETRARRAQLQGQMTLDPDAFLKVDPTKEKLTRQDIQWLTSSQLRMVQQKDKTDEQAGNTDRAMRILKNARLLDVPGLRPEDQKADPKRYQQFQGGLSQLLDQYNLDHQGKAPSEDDVKKMAKDLLTETVTSKGWFYDTKTPLYAQGVDVKNAPKMESIPQEDVNKIREAFNAKGLQNVTPQMVRRAYQLKLQRTSNAE